MAKRFKAYKKAIQLLAPATGGTSTTPASLPAGSALDNYRKYAVGEKKITYVREASSLPGEHISVAVFPFYRASAASTAANTDSIIVGFSTRSKGLIIDSIEALANHVAITNSLKDDRSFTPAKAIIRTITGTGDGTSTISKITGVPYKKKAASSATLPFGANTTLKSEKEVRGAILAAVNALTGNVKVNFTNESF
jgi:hypothetical protein